MDAVVDPNAARQDTLIVSLLDLPKGLSGLVAGFDEPAPKQPYLADRLAELGFLPGEQVRVMAYGPMGREPLAVRVGTATFALRRHEAACIKVCLTTTRS